MKVYRNYKRLPENVPHGHKAAVRYPDRDEVFAYCHIMRLPRQCMLVSIGSDCIWIPADVFDRMVAR